MAGVARLLHWGLGAACCLGLLLATDRRALAYVDPGSGLLALQSLAAALTAAGYFLRRQIARVFRRNDRWGHAAPTAPVAPARVAVPRVALRMSSDNKETRNAA